MIWSTFVARYIKPAEDIPFAGFFKYKKGGAYMKIIMLGAPVPEKELGKNACR